MMKSKHVALYAVLILQMVSAIEQNNTSSFSVLSKFEYGCLPNREWIVFSMSNSAVKEICISRDYNADYEPEDISRNPFVISFRDTNFVGIDEKKKTMTMDIWLLLGWVDERIKGVFPTRLGFTVLQRIATGEKAKIWNPFPRMEISNLKKRRYILDPIISKIGLAAGSTAALYLKHSFNDRKTLVWSGIKWRVTVSCPLDFSNFPFDVNKCPLIMVMHINQNLTTHVAKKQHFKDVKDGFEIKVRDRGVRNQYEKLLDEHTQSFGVNVIIQRDLSMYVYQYYLPSTTIVVASSVSFIIPLSAIPGRVCLLGTQFLTLTNIFITLMVHIIGLSTH